MTTLLPTLTRPVKLPSMYLSHVRYSLMSVSLFSCVIFGLFWSVSLRSRLFWSVSVSYDTALTWNIWLFIVTEHNLNSIKKKCKNLSWVWGADRKIRLRVTVWHYDALTILLDCSKVIECQNGKSILPTVRNLEKLSKRLCYTLHTERYKRLKIIPKRQENKQKRLPSYTEA